MASFSRNQNIIKFFLMNQSLLLLLLTTFCFVACSNTFPPEGSDLAIRELKGPIKFVEAKTYWAKRRAKPFDLDNLRLTDDFKDESKRLWYFNEDGNITKYNYFKGDQLKWEHTDSFDNQGNRIKSLNYDYSRGKVVDRTQVFTYDDNDNLLQKVVLNIDSVLVHKEVVSYNELEQKTKEVVTYGKNNRNDRISTFQYDASGRLIKKETTHRQNNPPTKVTYTYDGSSPHKNAMIVYRDGTITREEKYIYRRGNQLQKRNFVHPVDGYERTVLFNEEGWVADIKKRELAEDGQLIKHLKYEYELDGKGNWTQRATFEDEELQKVEIRTIEYY